MTRVIGTETNRHARMLLQPRLELIFSKGQLIRKYSERLETDLEWLIQNKDEEFARLRELRVFRFKDIDRSKLKWKASFSSNLRYLWIGLDNLFPFFSPLSSLKILDLLIDFDRSDIEQVLSTLQHTHLAVIEEVNFMTRNFQLGFLLAKISSFLISHKALIKRLSFRGLLATGTVLREYDMEQYYLGSFLTGICALDLDVFAIELLLLKGISGLMVDHDEQSKESKYPGTIYCLELLNKTDLVQALVLPFAEDCVIAFLTLINKPQKLLFHYSRNVSLFSIGLEAIQRLLFRFFREKREKIHYVVLHWAWSGANAHIIAAYNNMTGANIPFFERVDTCLPGFRLFEEYQVNYGSEITLRSLKESETDGRTKKEVSFFWRAEGARGDMELYHKKLSRGIW